MSKFQLKLHGSPPFRVDSVSTIIGRAADVCVYVGQEIGVETRVDIQRLRISSLDILYLLTQAVAETGAMSSFAQALLAANIRSAFTRMHLVANAVGNSAPLPGTASSAMADVIEALENDDALRGWSVKVDDAPTERRSRDQLKELRKELGGPKDIDFAHKVHIEIQDQHPGFPKPWWQIKWSERGAWQQATVAAPVDKHTPVSRFDKLVVDLEIHTLATKGSPMPREVFIKNVHWGESG